MDDLTFTEAVGKFRKTVYRAAYGYTGSFEDSEDISQEVFMRLYTAKKAFNGDEHMKAFLIRAAINLAKNLKRSSYNSKRDGLPEGFSENRPYYDDVADRELFDCVMRLPPKYRTAVYLYYYEDYSTADAAKIMGTGKSAFVTRLARAREQLKKTLEKEEIFYERKYRENI